MPLTTDLAIRKLAAARNALGVLALRRGDLAGAEREIRAAIDEKADVRLAHYNLALLAEQQGDLPRAIAEYKNEIELHANSYKAAFNLGRLHERTGDRQAQMAQYRKAIEMNPGFAEGHLFLAKEMLYCTLGTIHNLRRYLDIMLQIRQSIQLGAFPEYLRSVRSNPGA